MEGAGRSVVGFLLPIVFGGSVGPEAGLTGLIASACCRLRDLLKRAGLRAGAIGDATIAASVAAIFGTPLAGIVAGVESAPDEVPDPNEYELRRSAKTVLYFSAALAALGGASASSALFGGSGGLPRLAEPAPGAFDPIWFLPCIAFGYAFALVFEGSAALFVVLAFVATCGRYCVRRYRKADGGGFYHGWNRCHFAQRAVFRRGSNSRACV